MNQNGYMPLSATDLINLANKRKVARVDLSKAGYPGVVFVTDLTAAQQQKLVSKVRDGKVRQNTKEGWMEYSWGDLMNDADAAKILEICLVTDSDGGATLQRLFDEAEATADGEPPEYITVPSTELVSMFELMQAELKSPTRVRETLNGFGNSATSLIAKVVRDISGLARDEVDEKKDD